MNATTVVIVIVVSSIVYAFLGGIFGSVFYRMRTQRCSACQRVEATKNKKNSWERERCYDDHMLTAVCAGGLWPLTLPCTTGMMMAHYLTTKEQRTKDKITRKHDFRIAEIEAETKLAQEQKEKTLADIKFLVENGINADVPGLYDIS